MEGKRIPGGQQHVQNHRGMKEHCSNQRANEAVAPVQRETREGG